MIADLSPSDRSKYACALQASKLVDSGMKVGLGTGSTAYWPVSYTHLTLPTILLV